MPPLERLLAEDRALEPFFESLLGPTVLPPPVPVLQTLPLKAAFDIWRHQGKKPRAIVPRSQQCWPGRSLDELLAMHHLAQQLRRWRRVIGEQHVSKAMLASSHGIIHARQLYLSLRAVRLSANKRREASKLRDLSILLASAIRERCAFRAWRMATILRSAAWHHHAQGAVGTAFRVLCAQASPHFQLAPKQPCELAALQVASKQMTPTQVALRVAAPNQLQQLLPRTRAPAHHEPLSQRLAMFTPSQRLPAKSSPMASPKLPASPPVPLASQHQAPQGSNVMALNLCDALLVSQARRLRHQSLASDPGCSHPAIAASAAQSDDAAAEAIMVSRCWRQWRIETVSRASLTALTTVAFMRLHVSSAHRRWLAHGARMIRRVAHAVILAPHIKQREVRVITIAWRAVRRAAKARVRVAVLFRKSRMVHCWRRWRRSLRMNEWLRPTVLAVGIAAWRARAKLEWAFRALWHHCLAHPAPSFVCYAAAVVHARMLRRGNNARSRMLTRIAPPSRLPRRPSLAEANAFAPT